MDTRIVEIVNSLTTDDFKAARHQIDQMEITRLIERLEEAKTKEEQQDIQLEIETVPTFFEVLDNLSGQWFRRYNEARKRALPMANQLLNNILQSMHENFSQQFLENMDNDYESGDSMQNGKKHSRDFDEKESPTNKKRRNVNMIPEKIRVNQSLGEKIPVDRSTRRKRKSSTAGPCSVCGDDSIGLRFGVPCCHACYLFFSRNVGKTLECRKEMQGFQSIANVYCKSYCPKCRLRKCTDIGMKKFN